MNRVTYRKTSLFSKTVNSGGVAEGADPPRQSRQFSTLVNGINSSVHVPISPASHIASPRVRVL
ncbi:hypothetical protein BDV32DRAFT_121053 [Aspergillus pseudonomiae]|nr:hypothetical protein BDV32DRAFT_121053 [Aspergillus pseudonomiae]